jgi:hypothetical protein
MYFFFNIIIGLALLPVTQILKKLTKRPRPFTQRSLIDDYAERKKGKRIIDLSKKETSSFSMPSGDTA